MLSGKLTITLKGASFPKNILWIRSMNPYVQVQLGDIMKTSGVHQKGGKTPAWIDQFEYHKTSEPNLHFEVLHRGRFRSKVVGEGNMNLTPINALYQKEETINLFKKNSPKQVGTLTFTIKFVPDVQVGFQQGQFVQIGEAPLDMTLRVVSALLTRDTQWFGQMSCQYTITCGDKKFTSSVCEKGGKNPQWTDKFKVIKPSDTNLSIDIANVNNKSHLSTCLIPHSVLSNCVSGVRTIPILYEKQSVGQLFLEVNYNSLPQDAQAAPLPIADAIKQPHQQPNSSFNTQSSMMNSLPPQQQTNNQFANVPKNYGNGNSNQFASVPPNFGNGNANQFASVPPANQAFKYNGQKEQQAQQISYQQQTQQQLQLQEQQRQQMMNEQKQQQYQNQLSQQQGKQNYPAQQYAPPSTNFIPQIGQSAPIFPYQQQYQQQQQQQQFQQPNYQQQQQQQFPQYAPVQQQQNYNGNPYPQNYAAPPPPY